MTSALAAANNLFGATEGLQCAAWTYVSDSRWLLDLIVGQNRIQTFLALLSQEARASGVEIRRYEPLAAPSSAKSTERRSQWSQQTKPESAKNPIKELGYHRSSIALQVSGG